jgi:hypothetical protein
MAPVPSDVAPSSKITVPLAPGGTVAVRVTPVPKVEGFGEEARVTVLDALFTTCETGGDTAPL